MINTFSTFIVELNNVNSIMLGHERYSGTYIKSRNFLTTGVPTEG